MKSYGTLIYNPSSHLGTNQQWAVLMCDDEISRYYRHLFSLTYQALNGEPAGKLARPVWGAHISCIRGEQTSHLPWRLKERQVFEFDYQLGVQSNREYYWLSVSCPALSELRLAYGLSPEPRFGFHLTIGRTA